MNDPAIVPFPEPPSETMLRSVILRNMGREVLEWCQRKGWEPDPARTFGDECALIHSEVSEALEAFREWGFGAMNKHPDGSIHTAIGGVSVNEEGAMLKPEGVASEFADILIRLLHYATTHNIDLAAEFEHKMAYNERRAYRHGGKAL